ncbi:MAG: apolipoprotein N-acyltransferase, partial [Synechococcus sp. ELA619]
MGKDRRWWWIPVLGGGLLAGVALPPLGWPPLLWLALVPLWRAPLAAVARPLGSGFLWGLGAVLVSHRWL